MNEMILQRGPVDEIPELVGYDSSRIDALNSHLWKMISDKRLIGANYCIIRNDKIIANNALGFSSYKRERGGLMSEDTVMQIASVTKIVTAVAVFKLVEDGCIRPDEPMSRYIPQMNKEPFAGISIAQVLSHTSGLPFDDSDEKANPFSYIEKCKKGDDWIEAALKAGVSCKPGEQWIYSSFGYVLLGALIQNVSGVNVHEYITKNILEPLGMKDSSFNPGTELGRRHLIHFEDTEKEIQDMINNVDRGAEAGIWSDVPQTSGGLHSTIIDLSRFARMLCNGGRLGNTRILGKMSIEKMRTHYLFNVPDYCWGSKNKNRLYGMGPDLRRGDAIITSPDFFFHEGWGALCVAVDPREKLSAVWMVPYTDGHLWHPESLLNVKNIIWSGLIW